LYYRLNVFPVHVPALRERIEDIPLLAEHFLHRFARKHGVKVTGFADSARATMLTYRWPGNVRELQNVVRRAIAMTKSPVAGVDDLPDELVAAAGPSAVAESSGFFAQRAEHVARFERQYFHDLLTRHAGDVSAAAREARLPRGTLYRLMKGHGLDGAAFRK
jgi:DNA-binding NtrC family response regulator